MNDKETIKAILIKAGVKIYEEPTNFTILSNYTPCFDKEQCVHTLFSFNDDGGLITCRGYRDEDY
jgi:hypothetical protein